jgi:hypothetical protein
LARWNSIVTKLDPTAPGEIRIVLFGADRVADERQCGVR